ncbi:MAG: hypothetical protein JWM81_510 [Candidatus Saccharibacteria bacterium]|nr:hypothetical protein [Candidatus Saccharibacteria bacterium]
MPEDFPVALVASAEMEAQKSLADYYGAQIFNIKGITGTLTDLGCGLCPIPPEQRSPEANDRFLAKIILMNGVELPDEYAHYRPEESTKSVAEIPNKKAEIISQKPATEKQSAVPGATKAQAEQVLKPALEPTTRPVEQSVPPLDLLMPNAELHATPALQKTVIETPTKPESEMTRAMVSNEQLQRVEQAQLIETPSEQVVTPVPIERVFVPQILKIPDVKRPQPAKRLLKVVAPPAERVESPALEVGITTPPPIFAESPTLTLVEEAPHNAAAVVQELPATEVISPLFTDAPIEVLQTESEQEVRTPAPSITQETIAMRPEASASELIVACLPDSVEVFLQDPPTEQREMITRLMGNLTLAVDRLSDLAELNEMDGREAHAIQAFVAEWCESLLQLSSEPDEKAKQIFVKDILQSISTRQQPLQEQLTDKGTRETLDEADFSLQPDDDSSDWRSRWLASLTLQRLAA